MQMVIGPTPPGTGVIHPAFSAAPAYATSPTCQNMVCLAVVQEIAQAKVKMQLEQEQQLV
jgi:hypothetical protein